ncbi:MAG: hypothetical protein WCH40_11210 [Verrucomicrobiales bacterium]
MAKKTAKTVGSQTTEPAGENKNRYPAAMLTAENLGLHTGDAASEVNPSPRDYGDPKKLQKLYSFGIALREWAARFESESVSDIAMGSMDFFSHQRLLQYVQQQVATCAPEATTPEASSRSGRHNAIQLDDTVFMAMQLLTHRENVPTARWEPSGTFPNGNVPEDCCFDAHWELPDNPPPALVRDAMKEPVAKAVSLAAWWPAFTQLTDRVGKLGSDAVNNLIAHVNSDEKGGFSRSKVEEFVRSKPEQAVEKRVHDEFMQTLDALARLAERRDAGRWINVADLARELHVRYSEWIDKCFAPTVPLAPGRKQHAVRSTRKSKKDSLRRLVANVSQYGALLQGAAEMPRFSEVRQQLSALGERLQTRVKKLDGGVRPPSTSDLRRQVWLLDQHAVAASNLHRWQRCLGPRAVACGRLVEIIACGDVLQAEPWEPKEHAKTLEDAKIFRKKDTDKEFTEFRIRMQEAGIAMQAPWEFIEGKRDEPETKDGTADKWLLNPMAQILTPEPD